MQNLVKGLSTLTCTPESYWNKVIQLSNSIISHCIEETIRDKEKITKIDIGIGTLSITNTNGEVYYKFSPSELVEQTVQETYNNKQSHLKLKVEKTLGSRLKNTYKDLL